MRPSAGAYQSDTEPTMSLLGKPSPEILPAVTSTKDEPTQPLQIKLQRKAKVERDMSKRHAALDRLEHSPNGNRRNVHTSRQREERDFWLRPNKRVTSSVPSSTSWPPTPLDADVGAASSPEEMLSSSLPSQSNVHWNKRWPSTSHRNTPPTVFESALIFNQDGHRLSHAEFEELASSDVSNTTKQKWKRRVNRKPVDKKHEMEETKRQMEDDVTLELMQQLLPDIQVTDELNALFLGTKSEDVFHFEEPDTTFKRDTKLLDIDLMAQQKAMKTMVFHTINVFDLKGLSGQDLLSACFTPAWIERTVLDTVQLGLQVQFERFAVLFSIFQAQTDCQEHILKSVASSCVAIYHHQGNGSIALKHAISTRPVITFLLRVLRSITSFDMEQQEICSWYAAYALEMLAKCVPLSDTNASEVEKLTDSNSVESVIADVLPALVTVSPGQAQYMMWRLLRKWPQKQVQLQMIYLRYTRKFLAAFMTSGWMLEKDVVDLAFHWISESVSSPHFLVAKEACGMSSDVAVLGFYLTRDARWREQLANALHENAQSHWHEGVRDLCDSFFDQLLDFA